MDKVQTRLIQTVFLLNRQFVLTEHLIETRGRVLQEFEEAISEKRQGLEHVLEVYSFVFALIDNLVRYQKIAFVLPQFNHRSAEFRALDAAMGDLKDVRNKLQHINNDINNEQTGPLLGSVCWVSGIRQFLAIFDDIGRQRSSPGIPFDTHTDKYAYEFCYVCNDTFHDLGKAIDGVRAFDKYVNGRVRLEIDGKPVKIREHFAALCMEFRKNPTKLKP